MNNVRFSTREFDKKLKISSESNRVWIPISSQTREEKVFKVYLTDLELQDLRYQFSALTEDELQIFGNRQVESRPYEFKDHVHIQVTFEFDLTLYRVDRDVYSILDWIGDVGGLYEGLFLFFKMLLIFSQFNDFHHYLIERLYKKQD